MVFLFLGTDTKAKDQRVVQIKAKIFKNPQDANFDFESLDAIKLSPSDLKKSLITLPAIAVQRLVVLRSLQKLSQQNKDLILEFLSSKPEHLILVLDSDDSESKNKFIKELARTARVEQFGSSKKTSVFDMTNAISARKPEEALKILSELMDEGDHPLQIMGGLMWFWGKARRQISADRYKKGLLELQEADLNIKRSRLKPEHAMEVLVVKLCSLIVC